MRALVQRVTGARVLVDGEPVGAIDRGMLVYLGVESRDTPEDAKWIASKLVALRIFQDDRGKMNLSMASADASLLLVPNFTLAAQTRKGARPGFDLAMAPDDALKMFETVRDLCAQSGAQSRARVATGRFGAAMLVESVCDGPINLLVDSSHLHQDAQRENTSP